MTETTCKMPDPRVQRTRKLLQSALGKLLKEKGLEDISVQDIADAATLNRATFYDHYNDKFALLECMVGAGSTNCWPSAGFVSIGHVPAGWERWSWGYATF